MENASGTGIDQINAVAVDEFSGGVFVGGSLTGTIPQYPDITTLYGGTDGFVAKYDSTDGTVLWSFNIGSGNDETVNDISLDPSGNLYITGRFQGTCEFRGVSGPLVQRSSVAGGVDVYIAKYDPSGLLLWVVTNDAGSGDDEGMGVFAHAGGVVATGSFRAGSGFGFSAWAAIAPGPRENAFAVSLTSAGSLIWGVNANGMGNGKGVAVTMNGSNSLLTGTYENGTMRFHDNNGTNTLPNIPVPQGVDIYLLSVSNTGLLNWVDVISGSNDERVGEITSDGAEFYLTGGIGTNTAFPGLGGSYGSGANQHFFLSQHSAASGATAWVEDILTTGNDAFGQDIAHDGVGSLYVIGNVIGTLDLSGYGFPNIVGGGSSAIGILSYDDTGAFQWAKQGDGVGDDFGNGIDVYAGSNAIAAGGLYTNVAIFDTFSLTNGPNEDAWVGFLGGCEHGGNNMPLDQTICTGSIPIPLNASPGSGGGGTIVYAWEESADNITFLPASGTNTNEDYNFPGPLIATTYYRRLVSSTGCLGDTNISGVVTIAIDAAPSPAAAGPDQQLCATVGNLASTAPAVGTGNWAVVTGGGVVTTPGSTTSGVTGMAIGANQFEWTVSNGVCPASLDTIEIVVDIPPSPAMAGNDQQLCATTLGTLGATAPAVGTGNWTMLTGGGTVTVPGAANSGITGLAIGSNQFEWTVSNGICPVNLDTIEIVVDAGPSPAAAGPDQQLCATVGNLASTAPAVGTGNWAMLTGGGVVTTPGSTTSGVTGMAIGANQFEWTVSNGTCPASLDTIEIVVSDNPSPAAAGPDQQLCATTIGTLGGTAPAVGTGNWTTLTGGGTVTIAGAANSGITGMAIGSNQFEWTVSNGVCPVNLDTIEIVVFAAPSPAAAGPDQQLCATVGNLASTAPAVGAGNWAMLTGGGVVTTPGSTTSGVTGMAIGSNQFEWTVSNGVCPASLDTIEIVVLDNPSPAVAGPDQQLCATTIGTLGGTAPAVGTGNWTTLTGGGTVTVPGAANSGITGMAIGSNQFEWTVSNGNCPVNLDTIEIVVFAAPSPAAAGPDQQLCATVGNLASTAPAVGAGSWTMLTGGGVVTTPGSTTSGVTGMAIGANQFEWTVSNGVCPASLDTIEIVVSDNPSNAVAGPDQQLCATTLGTLGATAPAVGTGNWTTLTGGGTVTVPGAANSGITGLAIGSNQFEWTVSNGVCPVNLDTIEIVVDAGPSPAAAGPDQQLCATVGNLSATAPAVGAGSWTMLTGGGVVTTPGSTTSGVTGMAIGANQFEWTVSNGVCPASLDTIEIVVDIPPSPAMAGNDQQICADSSVLNAVLPTNGSGLWTVIGGGGTLVDSSLANSSVLGLNLGSNLLLWTVSNASCPANVDTVEIIVDASPSPAFAGSDQQLCQNVSTLSAMIPTSGSGLWTVLSGGGFVSDPNLAATAVSNLGVGVNLFVWTVSNGVCPSNTDTLEIQVDVAPPNAEVGPDQELCADMGGVFANDPGNGLGVWTGLNTSSDILDSTSFNTLVSNLDVGTNQFIWTISSLQCPSTSDTLTITRFAVPTASDAGPDQLLDDTQSIQLAGNTPTVGIGLWSLIFGQGSIDNLSDANSLAYLSSGDSLVLAWIITNGPCPASSDEVLFLFDLNIIPTAFSPNGDGRNESFVVRDFGDGEPLQIQVLNRWGNVVYESDDYQNNWTGSDLSGGPLSDDTYYVLLTSGEFTYAGYVVIKR